jgi:cytochrome c
LSKPKASVDTADLIARGKKAMMTCNACHANGVGPDLRSVIGRPAGYLDGYSYSPAMKNSGIIWDEETIRAFVKDQQAVVPGTKMAISNVDDAQMNDIISYLKHLSR